MNFDEELNKIKDVEIKALTERCLKGAPPHFWYKPASSTGKYHSQDENEEGGLIIHTKRVCKVADILIETWPVPIKADVIRSACILHDICKYGDGYSASKYTLSNHPKLGGGFVKSLAGDKFDGTKAEDISNAIISHMGKWGSGPFNNSPENLIVHLSDIVATVMYEKEVKDK